MSKTTQPLVSYEQFLAQRANAMQERLQRPSSNKIKTTGKLFTLPNGESSPGPLQAIILEFAYVNKYYSKPYNRNVVEEPDCIAISFDPNNMAPSDSVPNKQFNTCAGCHMNEWGSALTGRGKACKNIIRLAIVAPDYADKDVEIMILEVSPTGLTRWNNYSHLVTHRYGMPLMTHITEFTFDPNSDYPTLIFSDAGAIEGSNKLIELHERASTMLKSAQDD